METCLSFRQCSIKDNKERGSEYDIVGNTTREKDKFQGSQVEALNDATVEKDINISWRLRSTLLNI